eukprot:GHVS01030040.1.p1 GENE.GHVS01030040.1~~GHVS01030040.1.p1  ORF type:complete len:186 (+),score=63.55 GHVS01030040.1:470-1027(+)
MMELTPEAIEAARLKLRERTGEAGQRLGGKGTARRKAKKVHKTVVGDDKKLQQTIKRVGASSIQGIEEVQMTREDGKVMSFTNPKVQAAPSANTYVVNGMFVEKDGAVPPMTPEELQALIENFKKNSDKMPKTPENTELLRQLEQIGQMKNLDRKEGGGGGEEQEEEGDDDVPDLVEDFEDVSKQ